MTALGAQKIYQKDNLVMSSLVDAISKRVLFFRGLNRGIVNYLLLIHDAKKYLRYKQPRRRLRRSIVKNFASLILWMNRINRGVLSLY